MLPPTLIVLIESDWNLKPTRLCMLSSVPSVLIESDWNLKSFEIDFIKFSVFVLIESDWNLKEVHSCYLRISGNGINRIRLEFKVTSSAVSSMSVDLY